MNRSILLAGVCALALAVASPVSAKTLVFCSEGSPENFYPGVNTTGTSFDGNEPIYNRIVEFERGGTKVVPALAEKWTISPDGTVYTCLFASRGTALRDALRAGASDADLVGLLQNVWRHRDDRYSEIRGRLLEHKRDDGAAKTERVEMYRMGG